MQEHDNFFGIVQEFDELYLSLKRQGHNYDIWQPRANLGQVLTFHSDHIKTTLIDLELLNQKARNSLEAAKSSIDMIQTRLDREEAEREQARQTWLTIIGTALAVPQIVAREIAATLLHYSTFYPEPKDGDDLLLLMGIQIIITMLSFIIVRLLKNTKIVRAMPCACPPAPTRGAEERKKYIMASSWHIIGASIQGTAHQKKNLPCQDAHLYRLLPEGIVIMAVADGAGSAERSEEGAKLAVEAVVERVAASLQKEGAPSEQEGWQVLLKEAFGQARQAILEYAATKKLTARPFATTLTCAIASPEWLITGQIGDGVVVARTKEGQLFSATEPQRGEFANETYFLTMAQAEEQLKVTSYRKAIEGVAVMTDGLMRLAIKMNTYEPHAPFFKPIFTFASQNKGSVAEQEAELSTFLASGRVSARTDDDKTLLVAVRGDDHGHI